MKRSLLLLVVLALGCSTQSRGGDDNDLNRRLERQVRVNFNIPPTVEVKVADPKPSSEFQGYDAVEVTLGSGERAAKYEFLLTRDRKTLIRQAKFDVSTDPYVEVMKKIDTSGRPVRGAADAKVTVVNFDDFQCPFCSRMHVTLFPEVFQEYADKVRIIYKDYPLSNHPWAVRAAVNANCLGEQSNDVYWDYADYVHANQRAITSKQAPVPDAPSANKQGEDAALKASFAELDRLALEHGGKHGVDRKRLEACIAKQDDSAVRASMQEGSELGVDGTPTLFINGQKLVGAIPPDDLRAVLDRALREAGVQPPARSQQAAGQPARPAEVKP